LVERGRVHACHDVSDGGVLQALLEMSFASGAVLGFEAVRPPARGGVAADLAWFSEEPAFLVEVAAEDAETLLAALSDAGVLARALGEVTTGALRLREGTGDRAGVELDRGRLFEAWSSALAGAFVVREEALA
ncbi:MAG: AIR synthase-related protein, partial [Candidatus Eisenbacteria bacterium]